LYRKSESAGVRFYSQSEFNITNILNKRSSLLEAGRSCVRKEYRDGRIIKLLWKGLATYIVKSKVEYIFGCASFPSSDHKRFLSQLSYLNHNHSPSEDLQTNPINNLKAEFKVISEKKINNEKEFRSLPPLIKAYLRVGAYVGSGAVIDKNFDTTDVLIILDTKKLLKKYSNLSKGLTT
jgi:putative hemolysin